MGQAISHAAHGSPWHLGVLVGPVWVLVANLSGSFTQNQNIQNDCLLGFLIGEERFLIHAFDVAFNQTNRF
jgi:hypothetical protein